MTTHISTAATREAGIGQAAIVLARAAGGLFVHAVNHPGRPATISRTTGRVVAR